MLTYSKFLKIGLVALMLSSCGGTKKANTSQVADVDKDDYNPTYSLDGLDQAPGEEETSFGLADGIMTKAAPCTVKEFPHGDLTYGHFRLIQGFNAFEVVDTNKYVKTYWPDEFGLPRHGQGYSVWHSDATNKGRKLDQYILNAWALNKDTYRANAFNLTYLYNTKVKKLQKMQTYFAHKRLNEKSLASIQTSISADGGCKVVSERMTNTEVIKRICAIGSEAARACTAAKKAKADGTAFIFAWEKRYQK